MATYGRHFFFEYLYTQIIIILKIETMDWKKIWEKIKKWAKETALPWLKKGAIQIINVIVVLFLYGQLDNIVAGEPAHAKLALFVAGLWAFVLLGYWIFWKLLGADKAVKALIAQKKKKK